MERWDWRTHDGQDPKQPPPSVNLFHNVSSNHCRKKREGPEMVGIANRFGHFFFLDSYRLTIPDYRSHEGAQTIERLSSSSLVWSKHISLERESKVRGVRRWTEGQMRKILPMPCRKASPASSISHLLSTSMLSSSILTILPAPKLGPELPATPAKNLRT